MASESSPTVLLLIDIQKGLESLDHVKSWGDNRNNSAFEDNVSHLLSLFRSTTAKEHHYTVIHIRHDSVLPNSPLNPTTNPECNGFCLFARPAEGEAVFSKNVNSAFIGTKLENHLRSHGINRIVVAGLTTNHCVSTTVRMAGNLGFEVLLVGNACATFDRMGPDGVLRKADDIHNFALGDLHGEFCTVVQTVDIPRLVGLY